MARSSTCPSQMRIRPASSRGNNGVWRVGRHRGRRGPCPRTAAQLHFSPVEQLFDDCGSSECSAKTLEADWAAGGVASASPKLMINGIAADHARVSVRRALGGHSLLAVSEASASTNQFLLHIRLCCLSKHLASFPRRVGLERPPTGNGHSLERGFEAGQVIVPLQRHALATGYAEGNLALRRQRHQ